MEKNRVHNNQAYVTPEEAQAAFLESGKSAQAAREAMLERMGIGKESIGSKDARQKMIERQTKRGV